MRSLMNIAPSRAQSRLLGLVGHTSLQLMVLQVCQPHFEDADSRPILVACMCCCRAAGWSSLTPDDAEVVANMQYYVRSVLQPTADVQPGRDHSSHGWSLPQQALVREDSLFRLLFTATCSTAGSP